MEKMKYCYLCDNITNVLKKACLPSSIKPTLGDYYILVFWLKRKNREKYFKSITKLFNSCYDAFSYSLFYKITVQDAIDLVDQMKLVIMAYRLKGSEEINIGLPCYLSSVGLDEIVFSDPISKRRTITIKITELSEVWKKFGY